ncbi:hypothetical protein [Salinarimonas sp.]|uniref:hypothetical protein n=1 Tax=Salinarimonas sp. TaxID=2766526 RepID=UPI00391D623C
MLEIVAIVVACALLNALAASDPALEPGTPADLPRDPDRLAAWRSIGIAGFALLALTLKPLAPALVLAAVFLAWRRPSLPHLEAGPRRGEEPVRAPSGLEQALIDAGSGNKRVSLFARHLVFMLPGFSLVGFVAGNGFLVALAVPAAFLAMALREIALAIGERAPPRTADYLVGGVWGAVLLVV